MTFEQILKKENMTVLITGDSLSYNRYGYDPKPRHNAYNCGAGMPSWAFALRDRIYAMDPQFTLGEAVSADCPWVSGLDNRSEVPHTALFGGRIKTFLPEGEMSFVAPVSGGQVVLYLQRRMENYCTFDVYVDGILAATDVDTAGDEDAFAGYAPMVLRLSCVEADSHKIAFRNIRGKDPKITLAAVGSRYVNVVLTGRGSECTDFFLEHFEKRIGEHKPDLMIVTLGANDRANRTVEDMQKALEELYGKVFACSPECQILHILPPPGYDPKDPESDKSPYCSLQRAEIYDRAMEDVAKKENAVKTLRMQELFAQLPVAQWRFDNIHLNPQGNDILLRAVCEELGICVEEKL